MILGHARLSLRLNFRNRLAMIYGFAFPLIFLGAFWAIYRHDTVPLLFHFGELLTITILGGACFGLPTALVSEREHGVWRRYRLTPVPVWAFMASTLLTRFALLLAAAALQLGIALAIGMPAPADPLLLLLAFLAASIAFLGMGLLIAMLADSVPAVQALGQCIFLPMLMVGGIAVRLESLPDWAQHLSAFFPGRYAVQALQAGTSGGVWRVAAFDLAALIAIGITAAVAAARLFRWDAGERTASNVRGGWLLIALAMWGAVGLLAERRGDTVAAQPEMDAVPPPAAFVRPARPVAPPLARNAPVKAQAKPRGWRDVTDAELAAVAFDRLPPDDGLVSPIAASDEAPDPAAALTLDEIREALGRWAPGAIADPVQRTRNLLCVAAVPDLLRMEAIERFVPIYVFESIRADIPTPDLRRILYWIALHPDAGEIDACRALQPLGLPALQGHAALVRPRIMLYALKLLGRLDGRIVQR